MENNHRNQKRVSDIKDREHAHMQKMMKRMEDLEKQVKDVQVKLSSAVLLISEKDKEIEKLKLQVLQEGVEKLTHTVQERQGCRTGADSEVNINKNKATEKKFHVQENEERNSHDSFFDSEDFETPRSLEETVEERIKRVNNVVNKAETQSRSNNNTTLNATGNKNISKTGNHNTLITGESRQLGKSAASELDQESTKRDTESNGRSEKESDQELEEDYVRLLGQLEEMEKFLGDYGLIWVGDLEVPGEENSSQNVQASVGFTPNFDKVIMVISGINERTTSESKIEMTGNIAKFKKTDILKLTIYADGIQLEDNPFREYSSESVQEFFRDLEDGYYPTELKDSYPDGVIFRVIDKRSVNYNQSAAPKAFSGKGQKLGGQKKENSSSVISSTHLIEVDQPTDFTEADTIVWKKEVQNGNTIAHKKSPKGQKEIRKNNHEVVEESLNNVYVDFEHDLTPVRSANEIAEPVKNIKTEEVKLLESPQIDKTEDRKNVRNERNHSKENTSINFRDINITNITYNEAPITTESPSASKTLTEHKYLERNSPSEEAMKNYRSRTPKAAYGNQKNAYQSQGMISDSSSEMFDNQTRSEKNDTYLTDYLEKINANAKNIEKAIKKRASDQQSTGIAINQNENFDHITLLRKKGENHEENNQEIENSENFHGSTSGEIREKTHLEPQTLSNEGSDLLQD